MARKYVRGTPEDRFRAYAQPVESGCWEWTGTRTAAGYGQMFVGGISVYAHRWSFEQANGPIPAGMQIDHLCRNRSCCNPDHLEPVTQVENIRRGQGHGSETHCPAGHPYDEVNTYRPRRGGRLCRACSRERDRNRQRAYDPARRRATYLRSKDRSDG